MKINSINETPICPAIIIDILMIRNW